jgi:DHA2 family multidrug resistance protein
MSPAGSDQASVVSIHPVLGIIGVFLGASIATLLGRLLSVGIVDLRGALGLGVDEASWIGTAFNAGQMFIGPFSVYLGGLLGPRRVLLFCAGLFTIICAALPFAPTLPLMLLMLTCAGLTAGSFYPLTLSFVLRTLPLKYALIGIACYAMDIVFASHVATSLEAWYVDHLSWRWIFWNSVVLTPIMMLLIYFGIPKQPLPHSDNPKLAPNWAGFLYASLGLSLLYIVLDQGERLDWLGSGTIVALIVAGGLLLLITAGVRFLNPNPLVNFSFLARRNTLLLGITLICFRFLLLATLVVVPSYLSTIQGFRTLQVGPVLLWGTLPQLFFGVAAMYLLRFVDARLILTTGFAMIAVACIMDSGLSSAWSGTSFWTSQLIMAIGQAFAFNGLVGSIILEVVNTGALQRPIDVLTLSAYFHTVRIFGGEIGVATITHFLQAREKFHSNILGSGVQLGSGITDNRLFGFTALLSEHSSGIPAAASRAVEIIGLQVRQQAFTLAIADSFTLIAIIATACLLVIAAIGKVQTQYKQVLATPAPQQ